MTKEDKFEIGLTLNKIAMLLSNDDFHKVKNLLKHIEQIIAEQSEADTPQKKDEIVLDPSFAELSDEQFVKAMKLIEPQTDCGWK